MDDWGDFQEEMLKRFVKIKEGPDILRWGYIDRGSFIITEAYNIKLGNHVEDDEIWKKIWTANLWPKVALFVWLVVKGRILTSEKPKMAWGAGTLSMLHVLSRGGIYGSPPG